VATLIVVVLIYVAMALTVVFANRSLIFEQKTSANQYRSTLALEAAEAGLEWAMAMLNRDGTIGTDCLAATGAGTAAFKDKYLTTDAGTGALAAKAGVTHAACVTNQLGSGWTCSCPTAGTAPSPTAPATASGFNPAFSVVFADSPTTGTVNVTAYGCTATITGTTCGGDAAAMVTVTLGQLSGLSTPPAAPLTARGSVTVGNAALGVHNGTPSTNGITINAGLGIDARRARIDTVPGTPPSATLVGNDSSLANTTEDQMFQSFFKLPKAQYKSVSHVITCSPCSETQLQAAYAAGERQIWVDGPLTVNSNVSIGSASDPLILVVDGDVHFNGTIQLYGVVYSTGMTWDNTGGGGALIRGAAISEGNYEGTGTPDYFYDPNVLSRLRNTLTSFVRVPGSWRDF
jgi:hypothetical protein